MIDYARAAKAFLEAGNLNGYHAAIAATHFDPEDKDVLVVGCNRGGDCRYFVDMGASSVVGLDVMSEIGTEYSDPKVRYEKASAEAMPFESSSFDLVYAFATMEHVPDIGAAFREMARVCRIGGGIYCIAAPLWNNRQGPHWGNLFDDVPWAHLRLPVDEIVAHARATRKEMGEEQLRYLLGSSEMNKRYARDYLAAGWSVRDVDVIRNDVEIETDRDRIADEIIWDLHELGYSDLELFGLTHCFVATALTYEPSTRA